MPALRGAVGRVVRLAAEGAPARDVDDRAAPGRPQVRDGTEGRVGCPDQVGGQRLGPGGLPVVVRRGQRRVRPEDAGVVDQHVEPTEPRGRRVDRGPHRVGVGHVGLHRDVSLTGQGVAHLLGLLRRRPVVHRHPVTLLGEGAGDRGADAPGGTGHEDAAARPGPGVCGHGGHPPPRPTRPTDGERPGTGGPIRRASRATARSRRPGRSTSGSAAARRAASSSVMPVPAELRGDLGAHLLARARTRDGRGRDVGHGTLVRAASAAASRSTRASGPTPPRARTRRGRSRRRAHG